MRDPYQEMLEEVMVLAFGMVAIVVIFLAQGCAQTKVDKVISLEPPVKCRSVNLPPVSQDVVIDIKGDKITANAGGEALLRGYVACRSLSR